MQGIYTYIPEPNYVPREYIVAAILALQFIIIIVVVVVVAAVGFVVVFVVVKPAQR